MGDVTVQPSGIEGLGLFAARHFSPGERIRQVHIVREITVEAPLRPELGERWDHCDYPDGRMVLVGFPDRHLNHSCEPNCYTQYVGRKTYLVAWREIELGAELTIDYNINLTAGTTWPCHCGSSRCTGRVAGDYFQLPRERQLEYLPLLAEWFVRRHQERLDALRQGASRPSAD